MSKKGTRIATVLAAIAALALVVPASAAPTVKSTLKIKSISATGAKGTLSSKESACEKRRKVALIFSGEYSTVRIGTDKTDAKGRWKITKSIDDHGIYWVTTKAVDRGDVECGKAKSKIVRFNG